MPSPYPSSAGRQPGSPRCSGAFPAGRTAAEFGEYAVVADGGADAGGRVAVAGVTGGEGLLAAGVARYVGPAMVGGHRPGTDGFISYAGDPAGCPRPTRLRRGWIGLSDRLKPSQPRQDKRPPGPYQSAKLTDVDPPDGEELPRCLYSAETRAVGPSPA
jgi:hypothetical protein